MDKLREMETFVAVVECGSFSAAARRLLLTPAIVGRRIRYLEERLGSPLLIRTTRKLAVTTEGDRFFDHCVGFLSRLASAERQVSDGRNYAAGSLVVSAPCLFGRKHVVPHISKFMMEHPDVRVSLNLSDRITDLLREGYEVGIRLGPVMDESLVQVCLVRDRAILCATPAYLERHGVPVTPADLATHNCLGFNERGGQPHGWDFRTGEHQAVRFRPSGSTSCNDGELLIHWLRESLGIAWCSEREVAADLARGALVSVLDSYMPSSYDVTAVYPPQPNLPAKIGLFIETLRSTYADESYWRAG